MSDFFKKPFQHFTKQHASNVAECDPNFPVTLGIFDDGVFIGEEGSTHTIFVYAGTVALSCESGFFSLRTGMYAQIPGSFKLAGGMGIVMSQKDYRGFFMIGGPIENQGRLKYIDGCTDSLLVPPVKMGDPCLNLLYFPPGIDQTMHTHPSCRVGMVARGNGECVATHEDGTVERIPLFPGQIFNINAEGKHKFKTEGGSMTVIAYHPDSDFGPTDERHPMINRTIVDGRPAYEKTEILTK